MQKHGVSNRMAHGENFGKNHEPEAYFVRPEAETRTSGGSRLPRVL